MSSFSTFNHFDNLLNYFYQILSLPIEDRFRELVTLTDKYSTKELYKIYPVLIEHVFQLNLRMVNDYNRCQFQIIYSFLNPFGNIFNIIHKLISDCQAKFNFPITILPKPLQNSLKSGKVTHFYSDLINFDFQLQEITSLSLNAFDYYMFYFAHYLIKANQDQFIITTHLQGTIYYALFRDYIAHFLPIDPNYSITPHINYFGSKNCTQPVTPTRVINRSPIRSSPIFKFSLSTIAHDSNNSAQYTYSRNDSWRSETVFQAFMDFWINCDNYQSNQSVTNCFNTFQLPSSEHVIICRVFIKHLHAFSSTFNNNEQSPLHDFKKRVIFLVQTRVYFFLNQLFHHWPMDLSFRAVVELWLSFIQPWRYFEGNSQRFDEIEGSPFAFVTDQNMEFIVDNLLTYTGLFAELIPRFLRMDLSSPKKAGMVYRVAKVFGQRNLIQILRKVENQLLDTSANKRQRILELEGPNYKYKPMFSDKMKTTIIELLRHMSDSDKLSQVIVTKIKNDEQKPFGISAMFKSLFSDVGTTNDEFSIEEREKTTLYLTVATKYFSDIFEIQNDHVNDYVDDSPNQTTNVQSIFDTSLDSLTYFKPQKSSIHFEGNPDLKPAKSTEFEFLLKMAYNCSQFLNTKYSCQISSLYNRTDFIGRVSKQLLSAPQAFYVYQKNASGITERIELYLPPRLSFRFLADKFSAIFICIAVICLYFSVYFPFNIALILFFFKIFIIVLKSAFIKM